MRRLEGKSTHPGRFAAPKGPSEARYSWGDVEGMAVQTRPTRWFACITALVRAAHWEPCVKRTAVVLAK